MMNQKKIYSAIVSVACVICAFIASMVACGGNEPTYTPPTTEPEPSDTIKPVVKKVYNWEKLRKSILKNTDMVLLYGGSHHRPVYQWDQNRTTPYVTYVDKNNEMHWLFDSFLLIEFTYTEPGQVQRDYALGYSNYAGTKETWTKLLDYWFSEDTGIGAIDKTIEKAKETLGEPPYKRQIVLTLPEPIEHEQKNVPLSTTKYWGEVGGKELDFSKVEDQYAALEWYIDEARARFNEKKYKNIDFAGFYWVAEEASHAAGVMPLISEYMHSYNYSFNWIPYFTAAGRFQWKEHGFDVAYLQPNHYFTNDIPDTRLDDTIKDINEHDMGLEIEFDESAVVGGSSTRYAAERLRTYMNKSIELKAWSERRMAYYHGNDAIYKLYESDNDIDKKLYHEFCQFVVNRPIRINFKP
ncbi:MAG: DUF4855 domain-containing protein [Muribaculaceae bacterium]|nr:DUF4855 domain-containing protein [Muribaculaceae bacterium]